MEDTDSATAQEAQVTSWAPQKLPKAELQALAETVPVGGGLDQVEATVPASGEPASGDVGASDADALPAAAEPELTDDTTADATPDGPPSGSGPPINVILAYAALGLAIASVLLGFTGRWILPITACLAGVLCGHVSLWLQPRIEGRDRFIAVAGLIFSYLILAVWTSVLAVTLLAAPVIVD